MTNRIQESGDGENNKRKIESVCDSNHFDRLNESFHYAENIWMFFKKSYSNWASMRLSNCILVFLLHSKLKQTKKSFVKMSTSSKQMKHLFCCTNRMKCHGLWFIHPFIFTCLWNKNRMATSNRSITKYWTFQFACIFSNIRLQRMTNAACWCETVLKYAHINYYTYIDNVLSYGLTRHLHNVSRCHQIFTSGYEFMIHGM